MVIAKRTNILSGKIYILIWKELSKYLHRRFKMILGTLVFIVVSFMIANI